MLVRPVTVGGRELPAGTPVWSHGGGDIEHRDQHARVDASAFVTLPVRAPSLDAVRALDACFGLGPDAFEIEHADDASYWSIARCKAHGRRFLRDMRGGVAMYESTTLVEDAERDDDPETLWRRYHAMPIDLLFHLGRTR